ncbi:SOS response-associated peptidase family protein [Candidatus Berkiella aquae]|uniref:Abasic site processing protein n=1 Tax=Candidatus Berkiella aquae TaxID=295108 RepID=A0A0Q9YIQ5_9GAMM|nr:SOS response-associated peptidase [Candidatus Berkiella aquae]MCS5712231.1 SOS response-associated peptidase [Candidatus Berkiella aquae]
MPGRFALTYPKSEIENYFDIEVPVEFHQRYNISPSQNCLVLCTENKIPQFMHWGFSPFWNKDHHFKELINARSESVQEKPMFRKAFKEHRCVVIASGYYEWKEETVSDESHKQPFYISYKNNQPLLLAAIWDRCEKENGEVQIGFAFITTSPNAFIKKYHSRMPVIIDDAKLPLWLDSTAEAPELTKLFKALPAKLFQARAVSTLVNSPKNDKPACLE